MIKSFSKTEYFKEKNIPLVAFCRKIEPEHPARTHLIEALPLLGTQLQKIKSLKNCQNRVNLELANALKIIHELEYQLEIMTQKCHQSEQELLFCGNEKKQLERRISKLEEKIMGLESTAQKNQFQMKVKVQSQKEQYFAILGQYERRIEQLTCANNKLKSDREKELKSAEESHENSLKKVNNHLEEFEYTTQTEIQKLQKLLDKASLENRTLQHKMAELQTFNQQHLQEVKKTNQQLQIANLQIKSGLEHKMISLQAELDFSNNKNKELLGSIENWEIKFINHTQNWIDQRNSLTKQQLENEISWKKSYDQLMKRKQNIIQQLNKKSQQLSEKERELIGMTERARKSEKGILELEEEKKKILQHYEKYKNELNSRYDEDYKMKLNQSEVFYHRELSRKINEAVEKEQRELKEKQQRQTQRYLQKLASLEAQIAQTSQERQRVEQLNRQNSLLIEQQKNEIYFLTKSSKEQSQKLNIHIHNLTNEFENRIRSQEFANSNEREKLNAENAMNINILKSQHQLKAKELLVALEAKDWELQNFQSRLKKIDENYASQRMSFISRVQSFQVTVGKLKNQNEELVRTIKNLEFDRANLDRQNVSLKNINHQEAEAKSQLQNQFEMLYEQKEKIRRESRLKQENYIETIRKLETEIFDGRKNHSIIVGQIEILKKKIREKEIACQNLILQLKYEEQNKFNLQKKLLDIDLTSQEKWKIIEADFLKMNAMVTQESHKAEIELKKLISSKQEKINKMAARIDELEVMLIEERSQSQLMNASWSSKLNQLQQQNHKLMKQNLIIENLKSDSTSKEAVISDLKNKIDKMAAENQQKQKQLQNSKTKITQYLHEIEYLKNKLQQKIEQTNVLHQKLAKLENQISFQKNKYQLQKKEVSRKYLEIDQNLKKQEEQNRNLRRQLGQQSNKYLVVSEEKYKNELKFQQFQKQFDRNLNQLESQRLEAIKRISQLEKNSHKIQASFKQKVSNLQIELMKNNGIINQKEDEIKKLIYQVKDLNEKVSSNNEMLKNLKLKLDSEKLKAQESKIQSQKLKYEREEFQKKIKGFIEHIELLERQIEKTQKQIIKIYEEGDKRVQIAYEETKIYYESELVLKNKEIDETKKKAMKDIDEERQQSKKRQARVNEEKQQLYKETIEKACKIAQITSAYEQLGQAYEQILKQLNVYKKKWNKMFCEFTDTNEELSEANIKLSDFRTDDKKYKKIVRQFLQVRTQKTEKFMTTAENETPISQNTASKGQESAEVVKKVNAFGHQSQSENDGRSSYDVNRFATTLMSASGNLNPGHGKEPNSDVSVRQEWSSTSSKYSIKD